MCSPGAQAFCALAYCCTLGSASYIPLRLKPLRYFDFAREIVMATRIPYVATQLRNDAGEPMLAWNLTFESPMRCGHCGDPVTRVHMSVRMRQWPQDNVLVVGWCHDRRGCIGKWYFNGELPGKNWTRTPGNVWTS